MIRMIALGTLAATLTLGLIYGLKKIMSQPTSIPLVESVVEGADLWPDKVRIGYFHGGRTIILYRTQIYHEFEKAGVAVDLMTRHLRHNNYFPMPDLNEERKIKNIGKATGKQLVDLVADKTFHGATIGETAFIHAVRDKLPIVAVAELGHDVKDGAGHALVLHKDVRLTGPESFKGLRFGARRSAGGDEVVLREFLSKSGVNPDVDVKLMTNISDDVFGQMLARRDLDGVYGHVMSVRKWIEKMKYPVYVHRALDWIDPEMSLSVLVFHKDFVEKYPGTVQKMVLAYMRRVRIEWAMPTSEKKIDKEKGLQIAIDFNGLNLPEHRQVPLVQTQLLKDWQKLLVKHKALDKEVDLAPYIDNSFVKKAAEELY